VIDLTDQDKEDVDDYQLECINHRVDNEFNEELARRMEMWDDEKTKVKKENI